MSRDASSDSKESKESKELFAPKTFDDRLPAVSTLQEYERLYRLSLDDPEHF